ncbi:hypothetical protein MAR_017888 [Mya arenaria]|uniref:Kazal-like domain-containing protein n=1 Tax=Mya arenaria TaxID=6604 RepID=A0ABY7EFR5_MYAAR|nr:hypothetical protein MAR_017888 [Mya arenaria]
MFVYGMWKHSLNRNVKKCDGGIKKDCEGFCPCRSKSATAASSAASKPSVIAAAAIVTTKPTPVYKPKPVPTHGSKVYNPEFQLPVQAPASTVRAYPNAASVGAVPDINTVVQPVPQYIPPVAPQLNVDSVASSKAYGPSPTVVQSSNNVAFDAVVAVDKSVVQGPPPARVQALQARQVAMAARGAPPPNKPPPDCKCPPIYRPVCGVRGATYDNDCYRRCSNERKACNGECPCTGQPHSLGHNLKGPAQGK